MGVFFIDTSAGHVATRRQLIEAGIASSTGTDPPRPWLRIQGTNDASTMWYALLRRREGGIHLGALVMRHTPRHAAMLRAGWEEVPVQEIGAALGLAEHLAPARSPLG